MRILMVGMLGLYNRGCGAIVRGSAKILRQIYPGAEVAVAVGYPETAEIDRQRLAGLDVAIYPLLARRTSPIPFPSRVKRRLLYTFTRDERLYIPPLAYPQDGWDLVLEVGGDTFVEPGSAQWRLWIDRYMMKRGATVGLWGVNFEPQPQPLMLRRRLRRTFSRYGLIAVRDAPSLQYLSQLGVRTKVYRMADPAFEMEPLPWNLEEHFPQPGSRGVAGLNLSPLSARALRMDVSHMAHLAEETARQLVSAGFGVLFVPHCFPPGCIEGDSDLIVLEPAYQRLRAEGLNVTMLPPEINSPQVKYAISRCTVFAGARMHSTIAAWSTGVPALSLSYSHKSVNLNDEIYGHRQYQLNLADATPQAICERLCAMSDDLDTAVNQTVAGVRRMTQHTQDLIAQLRHHPP